MHEMNNSLIWIEQLGELLFKGERHHQMQEITDTLVTTSTQSYWSEEEAKSSNKWREIGEMKFK